jgi:5-methylcytosine-specific restriction protein B
MKKVEAIWLAGAILTYEKFIEKENVKSEDLYFKQSEIVKKAEELNKDIIPPALASSHCVANATGSIYNYLVAGDFNDSIKRRISYYGEFNNQKERPALNREITVTTIMGQKKIAELYDFIEGKFTHFILTNLIIEEDSPKMNKCNINTILYGPPGTGKTYNTVNYAVSIIENKDFMAICAEAYQDVFERYLAYKKQGQIRFVTFHQSYGYEEFIEGIKPVLNDEAEESIQYKIESGVFKEFCEQAQQLKLTAHNQVMEGNKKVWKISLGGSGNNWLKEECFKDNQIRIGWDEEGTDFIEDGDYPSDTLYYFYEGMSVGDIVFSLGDQKHIDAIGIVTGEPEWLEAEEDFKRSREVEWIATDIYENIYELNGKTNLVQQTIYELWRLSINDVNNLILKYSQNDQIDVEENTNNYVFIIDEINRGNISKIFGELITLIEPTKRIGAQEEMHVKLPYSKKDFGVPQNVYLLGTMNTADRSIALMDTALRRRFDFIEMLPNLNAVADIKVGNIHIQRLMEVMNARIEALYDREHTIGHAYFMSLKEDNSLENLATIFKNAIIPLLQEYFYEDYSKIQLVLGDHLKPQQYRFILDEKLSIKGLFGRDIDIDLPETKYHLQASAFEEPSSYIGIYGRVENEEVN